MKVEILWITTAVIFSQRDGLISSSSCAQITQHFMKDLNSGMHFNKIDIVLKILTELELALTTVNL